VQFCVPTTLVTLAPEQVSPDVQTRPSLQETPGVGACWHTPALHVSAVHWFPSSQLIALPVHTPAVHTSPVVQASASLQPVPFVASRLEHAPVNVSHVPATWH
jgi:hypothetical protein